MSEKGDTLEDLWNTVSSVNKQHFPENNLMPILGNGSTFCPKIMFVFINPTHVNISSDQSWQGPRFPFIGTKPVWRIFHKAGFFDDNLMNYIENNKNWSVDFTYKVLTFLKENSFYLTNIVKWTGNDATLPDREKIKIFLPILKKEIKIVKPKYIITFGLIPFENLTGEKIKLKDHYNALIKERKFRFYEFDSLGNKIKIIPCYFPVGRGNPHRAVEILKLVKMLCLDVE